MHKTISNHMTMNRLSIIGIRMHPRLSLMKDELMQLHSTALEPSTPTHMLLDPQKFAHVFAVHRSKKTLTSVGNGVNSRLIRWMDAWMDACMHACMVDR